MKLWIKILLGVMSGFGGGFAAGFFTHKKLNDIKFEEVTEEEMKEIEKRVKESATVPAAEKKEAPMDINALPEDPDKLRNALQGKTPYIDTDREKKQAYEKLWTATKDYSNEENANEIPVMNEEDIQEEEAVSTEVIPEENAQFVEPPHTISLEEFYNERPEYDKVTIHWYEPDNVWIDEREEFIPDIRSYIGLEVTTLFVSNYPNEDPDVRFVRNEKYGSDYEIIRHHRSYRETVGGVG